MNNITEECIELIDKLVELAFPFKPMLNANQEPIEQRVGQNPYGSKKHSVHNKKVVDSIILALTTPNIYKAAGLTEATPLEGLSTEEKIKKILSSRFVDIKVRKDGEEYIFEADFIKEYLNQFRTPLTDEEQYWKDYGEHLKNKLTDEELEKEAESKYPYLPKHYGIGNKEVDGYRKAHIAARKMGSSGWVSVEDRLPDNEEPVLVYGKNGVAVDEYNLQYKAFFGASKVTHWQPLSSPPIK